MYFVFGFENVFFYFIRTRHLSSYILYSFTNPSTLGERVEQYLAQRGQPAEYGEGGCLPYSAGMGLGSIKQAAYREGG